MSAVRHHHYSVECRSHETAKNKQDEGDEQSVKVAILDAQIGGGAGNAYSIGIIGYRNCSLVPPSHAHHTAIVISDETE